MKKNLLFIFLFIYGFSYSQVCIGDADYFNENSKKNKPEQIERFKKTNTIFVLPEVFSKDQYNEILSNYWKLTPYEIITNKEFQKNLSKYIKLENSIAELSTSHLNTTFTGNRAISETNHIFITLDFYLIDEVKDIKKKKYKTSSIASVFFTPDIETRVMAARNSIKSLKIENLLNFKLGYFKNYIQFVNSKLGSNTNFNCFDEFILKDKLRELKSKTLFVSEEIKKNYNPHLLKESEERETGELTDGYEFKYEIISENDLDNKITKGDDFYYLIYSQINAKKILTIVDSKTGEIVFNYCNRMSFNIKAKDFRQISREIKNIK